MMGKRNRTDELRPPVRKIAEILSARYKYATASSAGFLALALLSAEAREMVLELINGDDPIPEDLLREHRIKLKRDDLHVIFQNLESRKKGRKGRTRSSDE